MRIGVGITGNALRVVGVEAGTVRWAHSRALSGDEPFSDALRELLLRASIRRWPRPTIFVALGPGSAHVKRVHDLPVIARPELMLAVVNENASRFFPRRSVSASVRSIASIDGTSAWAALIDDSIVRVVEETMRSIGLRPTAFVPSTVSIAAAVNGHAATIVDGAIHAIVHVENGQPSKIRHEVAPSPRDERSFAPVEALDRLGTDGASYADAFGAAVLGTNAMLSFRAARRRHTEATLPWWRRGAATASVAVGLALPALVPIMRPSRNAIRDRSALEAMDKDVRAAQVVQTDLARISTALNAVGSFANRRNQTAALLADLTRAMPNGTAIIALQVDTVGGSLVALGERATAVMASLETTPSITSPRVVGPITREVVGGGELDRVSIRFDLRRGNDREKPPTRSASTR